MYPYKTCPECTQLLTADIRRCTYCGHDFGRATFENPPDPEKVREELERMDTYDQTDDPDVDAIFGRPAPTKYDAKELVEVLTGMGGEPAWTGHDRTSDNGGGFTTAQWTSPSDEMLLAVWNSGLHVLAQSLSTGDKELTVFVSPETALEVE